jgi:cobalt/nickel transport system permease protein
VAKDGFLEGSIQSFLGALEHALESEELARRRGLLQSLDPRVKLVGTLGLVIAATTSRRLDIIAAVFALACVLALCSRVPLRTLMLRAWAGAFAFTGLIALPAVFLTPGRVLCRLPLLGFPITLEGLRSAAYLISRVETTATVSMLLVLCTIWAHVLKALRVLRVPVLLVVVLGMTYRYILLMITAAREMFESRRSRTVGNLDARQSRRMAVSAAGVLLSRTMQLSGDVYLAMQARGFRGDAYVLDEFRMDGRNWTWLALLIALAAAATWAGRS